MLNIKIGNHTLYNGDCLEILKEIPDNSIDLVLTDPPYGIDYQSSMSKRNGFQKILNDKEPFIDFIKEIPRVLKNDGCMFIFTRWDVQNDFIVEMEKNNLKVKNIIIWDKVMHSMGDLFTAYGSRYESILFHSEKNFRFVNKRPADIIKQKRVDAKLLVHPNEKPVELLKTLLLQTTNENDTVLDCFMGSGTTGVACEKLKRKFIGIEIDEKYYKIAQDRIKKEYNQIKLF